MPTLPASPAVAIPHPGRARRSRRVGRALVGAAVVLLGAAPAALPLGRQPFVSDVPSRGAFPLVAGGVAAPIVVDPQDHAGVLRAAGDLQQDVERVTGVRPVRVERRGPAGPGRRRRHARQERA